MPTFADDVAAITQVLNRYSLAMDARRFELMDQVFLPDALIVLGDMRFKSRARGVAAIRACIECCSITHHMNSNVIAEIDGDRATASNRFRAWHRGRDARVAETFEALGTYDDEFVRTGGGWRIATRIEASPIVFGDMSFFSDAVPALMALKD